MLLKNLFIKILINFFLFIKTAEIALKLPTNTAVVEGEKLTIHCLVIGTDPIIVWTVGMYFVVYLWSGYEFFFNFGYL